MSTTTAPPPEAAPPEHSGGGNDDHGHGHDHGHDPFLAHHFGSAKQQFDAGKFGMWLFLVTEILFFSGLFCAYAVYRSTHPEAFANADQYLDPMLGAANTAVLIFSSLTMAWGRPCRPARPAAAAGPSADNHALVCQHLPGRQGGRIQP